MKDQETVKVYKARRKLSPRCSHSEMSFQVRLSPLSFDSLLVCSRTQTRKISAFTVSDRPRITRISTIIQGINGGIYLPRVDQVLRHTVKARMLLVDVRDRYRNRHIQFAVYYVFDRVLYDPVPVLAQRFNGVEWRGEIIVFRKGIRGDRLVNLRPGDVDHAWAAVEWCARLLSTCVMR